MRPTTALFGWLLIAGCGNDGQWTLPPRVVVSDSLVVSVSTAGAYTAEWRFDLDAAKPPVPPERDLTDHAVGELLLSGGYVVASARGTWFRQIYDSSGRLVAQFRKGGGPGELIDEGRLFATDGDTILFLHRDGSVDAAAPPQFTLAKKFEAGAPIQSQFWLGPHLGDGRWLGLELRNMPGLDSQWNEYDLRWLRLEPNLSVNGLITRYPWHEQNARTETRAWSWETVAAMVGTRLWVTFNAEPTIDVYDTTGSLFRRLRIDLPKRPVTRDEVARYQRLARKAYLATSPKPEEIKAYDESMKYFIHAPVFPYFGPMKVSSEGLIWVARFNPRPESDSTRFLVFDSTFHLVAKASLPEGLMLVQVQRDRALVWSIASESSLMVPLRPVVR